MNVLGAIAIFCDDVRDEGDPSINKESIIGAAKKNKFSVPFPANVPLTIYAQILIDPNSALEDLELVIRVPGSGEGVLARAPRAVIEQSRQSDVAGFPVIRLDARRKINAQVKQPGQVTVVLKWGGNERICGAVAFVAMQGAAAPGTA